MPVHNMLVRNMKQNPSNDSEICGRTGKYKIRKEILKGRS
jgi:hypothetical protein